MCHDGTLSLPDQGGTLSLSDPVGMLSPSDSVAVGPVGPDGTLSSSDLTGILFPAVPAGIPFPVCPVGPVGTLSLSDSDSVGAVGPDGTLSPTDIAGILFPADFADLNTVDMTDVAVVGVAPLIVTDVFTDSDLVTDEVDSAWESRRLRWCW